MFTNWKRQTIENMPETFSGKAEHANISNEVNIYVVALEDATMLYGRAEVFNTDQGSQFTSFAFTSMLKDVRIRISVDGKGRWMDNVMIERFWPVA